MRDLYSTDIQLLRNDLYSGRTTDMPPRVEIWKALLLNKSTDKRSSNRAEEDNVKRFDRLLSKYEHEITGQEPKDASKMSSVIIDPLSSLDIDSDKPVQTESLLEDVVKDVDRTFAELSFFRRDWVKQSLTRILYIYARETPDLGYRQGMHELVGPILYVCSSDDQEQVDNGVDAIAFALFEAVMGYAKPWYMPSTSKGPPHIVTKSRRIQDGIVRVADPELHSRLVRHSVEPQIWGIKWIRLLFGREFGFTRTLALWDGLFAALGEQPQGLSSSRSTLDVVDFVCAVMLLRVRDKILSCHSQTEILSVLLNYSIHQEERPHKFVSNALYLMRNMSVEGGKYIIKQYSHLWSPPSTPPHSPGLMNIESIVGAAKNFSQRLDIDSRFRGRKSQESERKSGDSIRDGTKDSAKDGVRDRAGQSRNNILADLLGDSLGVLEHMPDNNSVAALKALETIRHVRECLIDPERPAKLPSAKDADSIASHLPAPSLSTSSRAESTRKLTPTRKTIAQSEFSWMLGDERKNTSAFDAKDIFEL
uniref:ARAD1B10780p n=1 Tax=Blastobotrys adeninivorans TaxID=409370 RepID=A0A060TAW8_BLAAD